MIPPAVVRIREMLYFTARDPHERKYEVGNFHLLKGLVKTVEIII
jgi:hypothetical protein